MGALRVLSRSGASRDYDSTGFGLTAFQCQALGVLVGLRTGGSDDPMTGWHSCICFGLSPQVPEPLRGSAPSLRRRWTLILATIWRPISACWSIGLWGRGRSRPDACGGYAWPCWPLTEPSRCGNTNGRTTDVRHISARWRSNSRLGRPMRKQRARKCTRPGIG